MKRQILAGLCFLELIVFSLFVSEADSEQHPSTTGDNEWLGVQTFLGTVHLASNLSYAEWGFADSSITIAATQSNWAWITNGGDGAYTLWALDDSLDFQEDSGDTLTCNTAGTYAVFGNITFTPAAIAGVERYYFAIAVNGTIAGFPGMGNMQTDEDLQFAYHTIVNLSAGDKITAEIVNDTNNGDPTVIGSSLVIYQLPW